jgi:hypothetical protein
LQAGLEEETVKKFLKQLTYDKEGWVEPSHCVSRSN